MNLSLEIYHKLVKEIPTLTIKQFMETVGTREQQDIVEMLVYGYGQFVLRVTEVEELDGQIS